MSEASWSWFWFLLGALAGSATPLFCLRVYLWWLRKHGKQDYCAACGSVIGGEVTFLKVDQEMFVVCKRCRKNRSKAELVLQLCPDLHKEMSCSVFH